jgi:hypothetical protein
MALSLPKKLPTHFAFGLVVAGLMTGLGWFMQNHRLGSGKAAGVEPPAKQTPSFHESFDHAMTGPPPAAWCGSINPNPPTFKSPPRSF